MESGYERAKEIIESFPKETDPSERDRISSSLMDLVLAQHCLTLIRTIDTRVIKRFSKNHVIYQALVSCLAISYARPFSSAFDKSGKKGCISMKKYVPKEFWTLHRKVMAFRNEHIGHLDLRGSSVDSSKGFIDNTFWDFWEKNFSNDEMENLMQGVMDIIVAKMIGQTKMLEALRARVGDSDNGH